MGTLRAAAVGPVGAGPSQRQARVLQDSARPLVALASQLRRAVIAAPDGMKHALVSAVERFERELAAAGWDEASIVAASYTLCAWVDEVVAKTPWGAGGTTLLERFHGERDGGSRVLRLLARLAEQPRQNQALLELFHTCLSLGLHGHLQGSPDAARRLEELRLRLYQTLQAGGGEDLSPPWQPAVRPPRPAWQRHAWLGAMLLLGLVSFAVYTTAHLRLAAQVDEVFASMQQMAPSAPSARPAGELAARPPVAPRLAARLADSVAGGQVSVRDEKHRSVVSVPAEQAFDAGTTQLSPQGAALLARVGSVLAGMPGKVVVVGHTDGQDARTARLPSPWHQSFEWARETAEALGRAIPADRLAIEGAGDLADPAGAALPLRRVDIVLYP